MPLINRCGGGKDAEAEAYKGLFTGETTEITYNGVTPPNNAMFGGFPSLQKVRFPEITDFGYLKNIDSLFTGSGVKSVYIPKVESLKTSELNNISNNNNYIASPFISLDEFYAPEVTTIWGKPCSTNFLSYENMPKLETMIYYTMKGANLGLRYERYGIKYIEKQVFRSATVTEVVFPDLIRLGGEGTSPDWTFYETKNITTVDLGEKCTYVNCSAFLRTPTVEKLIIRNPNQCATLFSMVDISTGLGEDVSTNFAFYVPDSLIDEYKANCGFSNIVFKGLSEL